jgi:hypothetical protein
MLGLGLSLAGICSYNLRVWFLTHTAITGDTSYLAPRIGLAVNQIVGVQILLASDKVANTKDRQYVDLDTAVRGGSNSFGVATEFEAICTASNGSYRVVFYYPLNTT